MKYILCLFFTAATTLCLAQSPANNLATKGCGTPPATQAELQAIYDFVAQQQGVAQKATGVVDTIPLTLHVVGKSDGSELFVTNPTSGQTKYSVADLLTSVCELNQKYAPVEFYFAIKWPIRYISNSSYFDHNFSSGTAMMAANNVSNTLNLYYVKDPAGNCGYYSPQRDAIALAKSCSLPSNSTIAHELGHLFSLPHTFVGWEGGNRPSNPEKVTRGAGANCNSAADGFCDTPADYLFGRWNCPYGGTLKDNDGVNIVPDGTLYMSYSDDACTNHFSPQQIAKMKNNVASRTSLNLNGVPSYSEMRVPQLYYPFNTPLFANHKKAIWAAVDGAQYYYVKVVPASAPGIVLLETLTDKTEINFDFNLGGPDDFVITIAPLNSRNVCRTKALVHTFRYSGQNGTLAVGNTTSKGISIAAYPNPSNGKSVSLSLSNLPKGEYTVAAFNVNGQRVFDQNITDNKIAIMLPASEWATGVYTVQVVGQSGKWTEKVVVN